MGDVLCVWFGANGFDRGASGVLGAGRRLADQLDVSLHAIILGTGDDGSEAARIAISVRRATSLNVDDYQPEVTLSLLANEAKMIGAQIVLLANDAYCQELAPRLAHRLGGSSSGEAVALKWSDDHLRVTRPAYGGKAQAAFSLKRLPAVVCVRGRAMALATPSKVAGTIEDVSSPTSTSGPTLIERKVESPSSVRLEDASRIISGGRGLGGPEPFEKLRSLADVIGAELAASRAACDAGWVPPNWQVGQTGRKVAPDLYLAVAISGASQHLIGIADAKVVCAINTDPEAPIFKHSQFGLVEDYKKVVEPLREKLQSLKG